MSSDASTSTAGSYPSRRDSRGSLKREVLTPHPVYPIFNPGGGRGHVDSQPPSSSDCFRVLTKIFGHSGYKGKQKEVVEAAVMGADVFVVAPTGMGKSICFQVPAVAAKTGITLVVSPLLALMKNQVARLRSVGVSAAAYTSVTPTAERNAIVADLSSGHPRNRLLYLTPEQLRTRKFNTYLDTIHKHRELNRLVVDEAHCISEWGHDFRSNYRLLGDFRQRYPDVPIMALTASATSAVQNDIVNNLNMSLASMFKVVHPFNRENLFYEVRYASSPDPSTQMADIYAYISLLHERRKRPSSGIIYCRTKATCDDLSSYLRGKGLNCRPYHRGITPKVLDKTLRDWEHGGNGEGGVDVVCATIAFGMGIDKSDVRYIIHFDLPKSFEGYYQETGRAGRDGLPAKCVLYYSREDALRVKRLAALQHNKRLEKTGLTNGPEPSQRTGNSLSALVNFAESTTVCRHISLCRYFDEIIDTNDPNVVKHYCNAMCDTCKYPEKTKRRKEALTADDGIVAQIVKLQNGLIEEDNLGFDDGAYDDDDVFGLNEFAMDPEESESEGHDDTGATSRSGAFSAGDGSDHPVGFTTASRAGQVLGKSKGPAGPPIDPPSKRKNIDAIAIKPMEIVKRPKIANSLRQPYKAPSKAFKPPFKEVSLNETTVAEASEPRKATRSDIFEDWAMNVENNITALEQRLSDEQVTDDTTSRSFSHSQSSEWRSSSPIDLPGSDIELDVSFSNKIPTTQRRETLDTLRKSMHKVFLRHVASDELWKTLGAQHFIEEERIEFLDDMAQAMEFTVLSLSVTLEGYKNRARDQKSAIRLLSDVNIWDNSGSDELESANEVLHAMRAKVAKARAR
ncbi:ATP-dependent DNA helicase [Rickenella mellea]|uniref:ATP-dependent DNA helicase n=1 Tax=Rickenella mellea TaxID=50990 RepID=A0A4Y7Q4F0_9AGAM|nr:ATP-dependent DNA helicase [Rickenella mellea]